MDEYEELDDDGLSQVAACIEIGLKCVDNHQHKRLSIKAIVDKLSGQ